ncbi:hypothetical protein J3E71DRAFT_235379 [Bipolaris maydis]|nr:hypothetical protein J3E71DRAFT_235379 [Bipolaris maydis]
MKFLLFSSLFTQLFCLGTARFEPPPTTADPSTIKDCTWWFVAKASDTCDRIAPSYGINVEQLVRYNPILATSCTFVDGASYCVEQNFGVPPVDSPPTTVASSTPTTLATSTKFSSTLPATSTTPGNGVVTPQPTQPGMSAKTAPSQLSLPQRLLWAMVSRHLNLLGQACLTDFVKWNSGIGSNCQNMWAKTYVCVGV